MRRNPTLLAKRHAQLASLLTSIKAPVYASHPTAAALHGFDGYDLDPPFHVVVPRGRYVNRIGHIVHVERRLEGVDTTLVHGHPTTTPTRTLIDLAASLDRQQLTIALDSALRDLGTTEEVLHRRMCELRTRGRAGIDKLLRVIEGVEMIRGGHSFLEREFLRLVAEAGLPRPVTQQVLTQRGRHLVRVDCRFPGTTVVVELLGYRSHRSALQMAVDAARVNALQLAGFLVLQYTYLQIMEDGPAKVAEVAQTLSDPRCILVPGFPVSARTAQ